MQPRFDPKVFPDRIIFIDTNVSPWTQKMNCVGCGKLVGELFKSEDLCSACHSKWEGGFRKAWMARRFGLF